MTHWRVAQERVAAWQSISASALNVEGRGADEVFGYPDNLKFQSCMTLVLTAATDNTLFKNSLLTYFDGQPDQLTLDLLAHRHSQRP